MSLRKLTILLNSQKRCIHKVSRLFPPIQNFIQTENTATVSIAQRLMFETGIISQSTKGFFVVLPLGQRALNKLTQLIHHHMENIDASQVTLPLMFPVSLFKTSGRSELFGNEIFRVQTTTDEFSLAPTHEESITSCVADYPITASMLPLKLYQITSKFRNELRHRGGLIRAKEFLMKDLYTFDETPEDAADTYRAVTEAYSKIFKELNIPVEIVEAQTGVMLGSYCHEFHMLSPAGQDTLLQDKSTGKIVPFKDEFDETQFHEVSALELAHTFNLGTTYSNIFKAHITKTGKPLHMGSYGIGVSRLLAASLEHRSSTTCLNWPLKIAPYRICVILPKSGSWEDKKLNEDPTALNNLIANLQCIDHFNDEILIDDRTQLTVGKRLMFMNKLGIPYLLVIGKKFLEAEPLYELVDQVGQETLFLNKKELFLHLSKVDSK